MKSVNGFEPRNIQELVDVIVRKVQGEMVEFRCQVVGEEEAEYGRYLDMFLSSSMNRSSFFILPMVFLRRRPCVSFSKLFA